MAADEAVKQEIMHEINILVSFSFMIMFVCCEFHLSYDINLIWRYKLMNQVTNAESRFGWGGVTKKVTRIS